MSYQTMRRKMIASKGRPMTLQRITGSGSGPFTTASLSLLGFVGLFAPNEVTGDVRQGDVRVFLTNDEITEAGWTAPRARDQFIIDSKSYQVQNAQALYDGNVCIGYTIWARGG